MGPADIAQRGSKGMRPQTILSLVRVVLKHSETVSRS